MSGHVRLGTLDPELIETVVQDPDNAAQPIGIVTVMDKRSRARRYRIIVNGSEEVFTARTRRIRETFDTGECFFFKVNDLATGQIRALDEPFIVNSVALMFPRDPAGPAKEAVNCGCTSLPFMESWEVIQPGRQPFSDREIAADSFKRDLAAAIDVV